MTLEVWDRADAEAGAGGGSGAAPGPESGSTPQRGGRRRRSIVTILAALVFVLLVAGVVAVRSREGTGQALDPRNARPDGAQAVASVLEDRGVEVEIARRAGDLVDGGSIDAGTTVLVTGTSALSQETAAAALREARGARRLVLVEPAPFVLQALDLPVDARGGSASTRSVRAGCTLDGLAAGDTISSVGRGYTTTGSGATACFTFEGSSSLVAVPAGPGRPEVVVLGAGEILSNAEVTRHDNAGVTLRLLGRGDRLVWYIPSYLDLSTQDTTPTSEIPRALWPLVFLGLAALVATMLWRGRRFGPLVTEPLPAVVKAIETTQSRGRLYRRARDTGRAAAILRSAASTRLARYLGLPAGAQARPVAEAAARATGRPVEDVLRTLAGPPPADEDALIVLARDLSTLEKEVHRL